MTVLNALFDEQAPEQPHVETDAAALQAIWRRLESSHLPISFGCLCGALGHVRAQEFEQDVLSYLIDKYAQVKAESTLLQRYVGPEDRRLGGIAALLHGIANDTGATEPKARLLADLRRSILSWSSAGLAAIHTSGTV